MRHPSNMRISPRQRLRLSVQEAFCRRPDVAASDFVTDLGCELGYGVTALPQALAQSAFVVGVDLFEPYLARLRNKEDSGYDGLVGRDVVDFVRQAWQIPSMTYTYFCCEVLEHLDRDRGEELLSLLEEKADFAFVSVPHGFAHQDELDDNPLQRHRSGWAVKDFEDRGWSLRLDNAEHDQICVVWIKEKN